jgi:hypothetical protein
MTTGTAGPQQKSTVPAKNAFLENIFYDTTNLLPIGTRLVELLPTDVDHVEYEWLRGGQGVAGGPFEADVGDERMDYTNVSGNLTWDHYRFMLHDSAKVKTADARMRAHNIESAMEWFAEKLDQEILTVLLAGAGQSNAATALWDGTGAEIETDIKTIWGDVLKNSTAGLNEMMNTALVVPTKAYVETKFLTLIKNVVVEMGDYFKTSMGITIYPVRETLNDRSTAHAIDKEAMLIIPGRKTAVTYRADPAAYRAKGAPFMETERVIGKGDVWQAKQGERTLILEDVAAAGTTNRIGSVTAILA